jgi:Uma2 family endonuclease
MTQAKLRFRSFEEYAALDPSELPEGNYELVDGVIVEMGAERPANVVIASFLFAMLLPFCPYYLLHRGTEIEVASTEVTSRYPDLLVLTEAGLAALLTQSQSRSLISLDMPAPSLVIEIVSPGEPGSANYNRDYVEKPREYAQRGISEFWQVDPDRSVVFVLSLVSGRYKAAAFRGRDRLGSTQFPQLDLTAQQILNAGVPD